MARGKSTNKKVREIIIRQYGMGKTMRQISQEINLPKSTIGDVVKLYGETAEVENRGKSTGRPKLVTERSRRILTKICKRQRRSTLREVQAQWNSETGLNLSRECCRKWLHKSGYSFYKVNITYGYTNKI